jgi:hypothetical protein
VVERAGDLRSDLERQAVVVDPLGDFEVVGVVG